MSRKTKRLVYMDHSASTPVDPRVLEAMLPYFSEVYGNPSSIHAFGRQAEDAVEDARERAARVLKCHPGEIVFTSCGTESDNLAIRGSAWSARWEGRGTHLITSPIEHGAVTKTVNQLCELMDFQQSIVPVDRTGFVDATRYLASFRTDTILVSMMMASNEVGTLQPIADLAASARERGVWFHTDAVQAAGQIPLDMTTLEVDLLSLSGHKFYGPKGVGLLYVRGGTELIPAQSGGSHEGGRRGGTHNTPLIVGIVRALELAYEEFDERVAHYRCMRDQLIDDVLQSVPGATLTGHPVGRLPSHASFVIEGIDSNSLLMHLDLRGVAASGGSACKVGNPEPSSSLLAMGYSPAEALSGLRLTVGLQTTADDVAYTVEALAEVVTRLRDLNHEGIR